ncbi:hypothetical protein HT574_13140 [Parageobacillus sp. VR-IP]|uniref:DUF6731 family protein n=1 Tax=Parageobacillus sp. VR-IP TaxID=2742205 RepID=UPI001581CF1C|nr:DUF6731 family protein [Parageobacillus sp. VR-IP]NUK30996.1 hypothetical protein [Parageobacillus sp. VR-IP]
MGTKKINFDYFKVYGRWFERNENVEREGLFDLSPILEQAENIEIPDRTYSFYNDSARLQNLGKRGDLWALHFVRMRKDDSVSITTEDGDLDFLELEEGQYLGEEVSALYDPSNQVIMIQRNRYSLSPSGIAHYFNQAYNEPGLHIFLKPIVSPEALDRIDSDDLFRGIEISIADFKNATDDVKKTLTGLTRNIEETPDPVNVKIILSLDRKSKKSSSIKGIYDLLNKFSKDENVKKMEIRKKDDEESPVEKFDLIEDRLGDHAYFKIDRENPLEHDKLINKMIELYRGRKEYIDQITI